MFIIKNNSGFYLAKDENGNYIDTTKRRESLQFFTKDQAEKIIEKFPADYYYFVEEF